MASIERVRASLPESRHAEFNEAVTKIYFSQIDMADIFAEGLGNLEVKAMVALDGLTGEQVIQATAEVKKARKKREQSLVEIRELENLRILADMTRNGLKVSCARYYKKEMGLRQLFFADLIIKNEGEIAISRIYFKAVLASSNRKVPWNKGEFWENIPGGLEPGEVRQITVLPLFFSGGVAKDAPPDALLTVTIERLDGPDGETLYSAMGFDERDRKRLSELKEEYGKE